MSSSRRGGKFLLPHKVRWGENIDETTIDKHGYNAGLAGRKIWANPTRGDTARPRWVKAYRAGEAERRRVQRRQRRDEQHKLEIL